VRQEVYPAPWNAVGQPEVTNKGDAMSARRITRREAMKTAGALVGAGVLTGISGALPTLAPRAAAQASAPSGKALRIGFQVHRTGIGATYGSWYEKTALQGRGAGSPAG